MSSDLWQAVQIPPSEAKENYYRVFRTLDPFDAALFTSKIERRIILCQTAGFHLTKHQYAALLMTLQELNSEDYFLLSRHDIHAFCEVDLNGQVPCHLKCPKNYPHEKYRETGNEFDLCLYSPCLYSQNGNWGIILSDEWSAALGGTVRFVATFQKYYPAWKYGYHNFVEYLKDCEKQYNTDISQISTYLEQFEIPDLS